ncbi:hypothetical protein CR513_13488, partial [Mucuna pruriens]
MTIGYLEWPHEINTPNIKTSQNKIGLKAESMSTQKEHLGLVEAESIPTQAEVTEQEIYRDQGINDSAGSDLDLASLCINKACQATSSDQDLGSWKLLEVITRYSRGTPVDGNLNVWPSLVHHYCPSIGDHRNTHHFDNGGSMASKGRNGIAVADNKRFEGYIDGCGMRGSIGHPPNDCPILQEPPPPFNPQLVQESSLEDLMKQLVMNNIQFQKNVSATQQPMQQLNNSPSLKDLIQQNNMQFQQNIIATMQELTAQIGQLATTINQLQFEDFGQVPSQAILSPQENISDITMRSDMELPQQQSLKVQYGFSGILDSENSTICCQPHACCYPTKMAEIDDYVPTISDLADVVKIANSMTDVTNLTDMTLDEISDQVTRVEIVDPACVDITNPTCAYAKMADPKYANADNAFADRAEDVDSLVDKSDSVNMTKMADSAVSMSNHANIFEVANSMMEVPSLADIIEVADSRVNISTFADMPEMLDFVANVSNFANVVDNSKSADITKVLDFGIEVSDPINNFLAHEPTLADSYNQS